MKAVVLNGPNDFTAVEDYPKPADWSERYAVGDEEDSNLWHRYKNS